MSSKGTVLHGRESWVVWSTGRIFGNYHRFERAQRQEIQFIRQGAVPDVTSRRSIPKFLTLGGEWRIDMYFGRQLCFPGEICSTPLWPNMVLWSRAAKWEQWEDGIEKVHKRKKAKHSDPVTECREGGWSVRLYPTEVEAGDFVVMSATGLLKYLRMKRTQQQKALCALGFTLCILSQIK